ncbi:hypothetical protein DRJ19_03665 [Candidatus Woesearchaeota archaeon]|nr:MAG: hypothetical protein DRJ19_03665 [Candidatus Woesearchaeota archaeon]
MNLHVELVVAPETSKYTTILWVSRHPPLPAQIKVLKEKLGDIKLVQVIGTIPGAEYVIDLAKDLNAKVIVPVLPLSFIAHLSEMARREGLTVLWAEMEQTKMVNYEPKPSVDYNPENETWVRGYNNYRVLRFKKFHVVKAVKLEFEPW